MMNNKDDYKKIMDQIHAPEDLKQRTFEKMNKKQVNFVPLKLLSAVAVVMIVFVAGYNYFDKSNVVYTPDEEKEPKKEIVTSNDNIELPRFKDRKELVDMLKENNNYYSTNGMMSVAKSSTMVDGAVEESATMDVATNQSRSVEQGDFSKTNNQVDSVDEADIVKTDGKHIFYTSNGIVNVIDANTLELLAEIKGIRNENETFTPYQIFLNGNKLVVLGNYTKSEKVEEREDQEDVLYDYAYINYHEMAKAMVYDLSNINQPQLVREIALDGYYKNARMIEDNVYFISTKGAYFYDIDNIKDEEILPVVCDSIALVEEKRIDYTDIAYFPGTTSYSYLLVGGFNLNNNEPLSVETFFGAGDIVYCSENNLYLTQTKYDRNYSKSNIIIYKFELDNGKVSLRAKGEVEGDIKNQFSLDEFEGNLRIASTVVTRPSTYINFLDIFVEEEVTNRVYILDEDLNELSRIDNMADGERIYAVRFMGKVGYVVTFEQIDPLFVLDLSDPKNPEIKGELKIPGYSSYLHPYDETHVIGIGYNTKDNGYGGVTNANMKMSMFDISDLNNPKEMFSTSIGLEYAHSEVTYDQKGLFYKASDNLIGFGYSTYDRDYSQDYWSFDIFHIDLEKGFENFARFSQKHDYQTNIKRMIYIGNTVYGLAERKVTSYDLNTQVLLHELDLNTLYDDEEVIVFNDRIY